MRLYAKSFAIVSRETFLFLYSKPYHKHGDVCRADSRNSGRLSDRRGTYLGELFRCFKSETLDRLIVDILGKTGVFAFSLLCRLVKLTLYITCVLYLGFHTVTKSYGESRSVGIKLCDSFVGDLRSSYHISR